MPVTEAHAQRLGLRPCGTAPRTSHRSLEARASIGEHVTAR